MKSLNRALLFCFLLVGCSGQQLHLDSAMLEEYRLVEKYEEGVSAVFVFSSGDDLLRIEQISGIDEASATTYIEESKITLEALYANTLTAYPGSITQEIVCDAEYLPRYSQRERHGNTYRYYLLYTTERYGLGACSEDLVAFKHLYGWVYCSDNLFTIQSYLDTRASFSELESLFFSMRCDGN